LVFDEISAGVRILGSISDDFIARQEMRVWDVPDVVDCIEVDDDDDDDDVELVCCGCLCTRYVYGFSYIDPCDPGDCDEIDVDGTWPGVTLYPPSRKKDDETLETLLLCDMLLLTTLCGVPSRRWLISLAWRR
jgi:hypothetical protein